jgi:hypothetical protein
LTSEHYLNFLEDKLPLLDASLHIRQEQQDGTPPHFGRQVIAFLKHLQNHWIGWQGPVAWPLRLPGLLPLDCYLWARTKSQVYALKSSTRAELLNHILDASTHTKNNKPSFVRSFISLSQRQQCA